MNKNFKIYFLFIVLVGFARAELVRESYEGIRALGMGNAFIGLADDANALWYNPAGLARVKGFHGSLFDFTLGVDSLDTLNRAGNALFRGDTNNLIRTDTEFLRFSTKATSIFPYFGLSLFQNFSSFTYISNLMLPTLDIYMFNDMGVVGGIGIPMGEYFSFGLSAKFYQRSSIDLYNDPAALLAAIGIPGPTFMTDIFNYLRGQMGVGYGLGLNVGSILRIPLDKKSPVLQLAATIEDFGNTSFTALAGQRVPNSIHQNINFGGALLYKLDRKNTLNITCDFRHNFENYPINKMLHAGVEYRNNLFAFRAGIYQGYPTFGASIEMPHHTRLHFASYAVELGTNWWQNSQRWYLMQMIIGFNPI